MCSQEIELVSVIKDIAAGPFGSNLKVSSFTSYGFPIIDGANLKDYKVSDNITKFVSETKARSLHRSIAHRGDCYYKWNDRTDVIYSDEFKIL